MPRSEACDQRIVLGGDTPDPGRAVALSPSITRRRTVSQASCSASQHMPWATGSSRGLRHSRWRVYQMLHGEFFRSLQARLYNMLRTDQRDRSRACGPLGFSKAAKGHDVPAPHGATAATSSTEPSSRRVELATVRRRGGSDICSHAAAVSR